MKCTTYSLLSRLLKGFIGEFHLAYNNQLNYYQMKTLKLLLLVLSLQWINAQQPSKIKDVTVYLDGAEITRSSDVNLGTGTTEFTFNGLSPNIQESSIQISGLKKASILSINCGINYLSKQKRSDSITSLQNELKDLDAKVQYQYDLIAGYNEELSLIQSNKRLGNETEVVSLEKLKSFATYYRTRITELRIDVNTSNKGIQDHQKTQIDIRKQLAEFNVDEKVQTGEITIKLNSEIATKLDLKISYNISNAGWFPIYDLKAEKINSPINLEYKAHVYQNSGCDWDDVKLVLSTSDPNTNNEKPIVNPKYLNFISAYSNYKSQRATRHYNYKYNPLVKTVSGVVTSSSDGLPLPGASVIIKGTSHGAQTDFDGRYTLSTKSGNTLTYSYVGMNTEELPIHSSVMNVALDDGATLDEVAIVGYGTTTKNAYAGTATIVKSEDIVSGLYGSASGVTIRGASTLNSKSNLLYIVDGIPVKPNAASKINPDSIESIEILKGNQATGIYGNRASNGVIVINTRNTSQRKTNDLGVVVETGITNTRFEIDKTYSIPSDGDVTVIEIDKFSVPATYDYFAAPLLNENVFLTAQIGNWEQYNLLPAEANVYFEGSYSGKTNINPGATTDSLTISLGVDPNIIVKRKQLNDFKKSTFIGSNKVVYKGFEIEIKNNKQSNIKLSLYDRIPKSQNKAIKLDDIETGTSSYDKEKGVLKWELNLKPGETDKVKHSYVVKYPKEKRVNL
jgi:TonB-dependent SusC/RagA subfamily outer membrane receptor